MIQTFHFLYLKNTAKNLALKMRENHETEGFEKNKTKTYEEKTGRNKLKG